MEWIVDLLARALVYASPILVAALGELMLERTGLVNLGVEGMMALGAAVGAIIGAYYQSPLATLLGGGFAGVALASLYAVLVVKAGADQIVVGLGLVFLGLGLAELVGSYIDAPSPPLGILWYKFDTFQAIAIVLALLAWYILYKTWIGYELRSIGENPEAARALGARIEMYRYFTALIAGLLAGMAGAYLVTGMYYGKWFSGITRGLGWIAIGMVILGYWNPLGLLVSTYIVGLLFVIEPLLAAQGLPLVIANSLPYIAVIVLLALIALIARRKGIKPPTTIWLDIATT